MSNRTKDPAKSQSKKSEAERPTERQPFNQMQLLEDKILICVECREEFVYFKGEQVFYMRRQEDLRQRDPTAKFPPPKRCPVCRRKAQQLRSRVKIIQARETDRMVKLGLDGQIDIFVADWIDMEQGIVTSLIATAYDGVENAD